MKNQSDNQSIHIYTCGVNQTVTDLSQIEHVIGANRPAM